MANAKRFTEEVSARVWAQDAGEAGPVPGILALGQSLGLVRAGIETYARACWRNACVALFALPDAPEAVYIEGWVSLPSGLVLDHGWVRLSPGVIIDTTVALLGADDWAGATYCEGLAYEHHGVGEALERGQPPFVRNGPPEGGQTPRGGFWSLAYRLAHHRAMTVVGGPSPWRPGDLSPTTQPVSR